MSTSLSYTAGALDDCRKRALVKISVYPCVTGIQRMRKDENAFCFHGSRGWEAVGNSDLPTLARFSRFPRSNSSGGAARIGNEGVRFSADRSRQVNGRDCLQELWKKKTRNGQHLPSDARTFNRTLIVYAKTNIRAASATTILSNHRRLPCRKRVPSCRRPVT